MSGEATAAPAAVVPTTAAPRRFIDERAISMVAATVSLRQSATETPVGFVRRIVGAYLIEAGR